MKKLFSLITCINNIFVIGNKNKLMYHISNDLKNFKKLTLNQVVIYGRKTYESIGKSLPQRINIILTRDIHFQAENCIIAHSLEECLSICKEQFPDKEWFVIGGSQIYNMFLRQELVDKLYITKVDDDSLGDSKIEFFDILDSFNLISESEILYDESTHLNYKFQIYQKNIKI